MIYSHFSAINQLWDQQIKALEAFQKASEASEVLLDACSDTTQQAISALTLRLVSRLDTRCPVYLPAPAALTV
jgi:hypothetical protein